MTAQFGQSISALRKNMENKTRMKEFALIYLVAIILLLGIVAFIDLSKGILSITGFAVLENESNETISDETQSDEEINVIDLSERIDATDEITATNEAAINETTGETENKEKPEKEEKEKPEQAQEPNQPPVWKSDVEEFTISGETTIDLNNYFEDKNNDTILYAAIASEPDKISAEIDGSLITIKPAGG